MPKKRITIPKGAKDCQGVECQQNLEFEVDIADANVTATTIPTPSFTVSPAAAGIPQTVLVQQPPPPPETKPEEKLTMEQEHEKMNSELPSGVNYAKCDGADCGHVKLKNPNQTTKHKACPNCKNNNVPTNSDFCPNCGIEEESKKFEEWEDSDIEIEEEKEE